jgi:hypothetical protein
MRLQMEELVDWDKLDIHIQHKGCATTRAESSQEIEEHSMQDSQNTHEPGRRARSRAAGDARDAV